MLVLYIMTNMFTNVTPKKSDLDPTAGPSAAVFSSMSPKKIWESDFKEFYNGSDYHRFLGDSFANSPPYFAVHVSAAGRNGEVLDDDQSPQGIYGSLKQAKDVCKQFKAFAVRFESFSTYEKARQYLNSGGPNAVLDPAARLLEEEPLPFTAPTRSDLLQLRKLIESGHFEKFVSQVEMNPRVLINEADTPRIIHEGSRYNALHVAARHGRLAIAKSMLRHYVHNEMSCIGRNDDLWTLYPKDSPQMHENRCVHVRTAFFQMRDKTLCASPLHFAARKGYSDFVQFLTEQAECDINARNIYGYTALHDAAEMGHVAVLKVLCSSPRCDSSIVNSKDQTAIQVAESNGEMENLGAVLEILRQGKPYHISLYRDSEFMAKSELRVEQGNPFFKGDLSDLKPNVKWFLAAVIGPTFSENEAKLICQKWNSNNRKHAMIKLSDIHKGLERIGRTLAVEYTLPWTEFWSFLNEISNATTSPTSSPKNSYCNLGMESGLELLEQYLAGCEKTGNTYWTSIIESGGVDSTFNPNSPLPRKSHSVITRSKMASKLLDESPLTVGKSVTSSRSLEQAMPARKIDFGEEIDVETFYDSQDEYDFGLSASQSSLGELPDNFGDLSTHSPKSKFTMQPDCPVSILISDCGSPKDEIDDNFETPPSSPTGNFVAAARPSKADLDILRALETVELDLLRSKFKHVYRLKVALKFYSEDDQKKWPSLDSPRARDLLKRKDRFDTIRKGDCIVEKIKKRNNIF